MDKARPGMSGTRLLLAMDTGVGASEPEWGQAWTFHIS
jgi:hypothetical protein